MYQKLHAFCDAHLATRVNETVWCKIQSISGAGIAETQAMATPATALSPGSGQQTVLTAAVPSANPNITKVVGPSAAVHPPAMDTKMKVEGEGEEGKKKDEVLCEVLQHPDNAKTAEVSVVSATVLLF